MAEANLTSEDLYAILELTNTANSDDIRRSYQRLAKQVPVNFISIHAKLIISVVLYCCVVAP